MWQYIERENIDVVPLYFSAPRPTVMRDGAIIMVDDDRLPIGEDEKIEMREIRFRTLGCYPLTGAIEATAKSVGDIVRELENSRVSERQGRLIDQDQAGSMEKKKRVGYF